MDKKRLKELAGIIVEDSGMAGGYINQMADIFENAVKTEAKKLKIEEGDADGWAEVTSGLMEALHEELKERGYYG